MEDTRLFLRLVCEVVAPDAVDKGEDGLSESPRTEGPDPAGVSFTPVPVGESEDVAPNTVDKVCRPGEEAGLFSGEVGSPECSGREGCEPTGSTSRVAVPERERVRPDI